MNRIINLVRITDMKNFVRHCGNYEAKITVEKDGFVVDAKSILGVLSIGDLSQITVRYHAEGKEASDFFIDLNRVLLGE